MLVYAVVTPEEKAVWNAKGHPMGRKDVEVMEFPTGGDLKERLLKKQLPGLLILDDACFGGEASGFLADLREVKAWASVPALILLGAHREAPPAIPGVTFLKKPAAPSTFEEIIKPMNLVTPRRYPRKEVMAKCAIISVGKRLECVMRDISLCGCRIDYGGTLGLGGMVQMGFSLKFGYRSFFIKTTAKVVREIRGGYGLTFLTMEPQSRSVIASYVKGQDGP